MTDNRYSRLIVSEYEGAGNRTPVIDVSSILPERLHEPEEIRRYLQTHIPFLRWLRKIGVQSQADSIMLYHKSYTNTSEYVTYIGEPGASFDQPFSEMCGNGIRNLALHIFLESNPVEREQFLKNGVAIWAGENRNVIFRSVDIKQQTADVLVDLGPFTNSPEMFSQFVNLPEVMFQKTRLIRKNNMQNDWPEMYFGLNGRSTGEPHLVMFYDLSALDLNKKDAETILYTLRSIVSKIGPELTYDSMSFPHGMNVNVAAASDGVLYMTTHERSICSDKEECLKSRNENGFCRCNTQACGTGGSIVANLAYRTDRSNSDTIKTVHPGGVIYYEVSEESTYMIGPARRL